MAIKHIVTHLHHKNIQIPATLQKPKRELDNYFSTEQLYFLRVLSNVNADKPVALL